MQSKESGYREGCQEVIAGTLSLGWHLTYQGSTDMAGAQLLHLNILTSILCSRLLALRLAQLVELWAREAEECKCDLI